MCLILELKAFVFAPGGKIVSMREGMTMQLFGGVGKGKRGGGKKERKAITPNKGENMENYRKAVRKTLEAGVSKSGKLGGRELLEIIVRKWGVAYDIQIRKNTPFGEASGNVYLNVMWRYFGQKSFPMDERAYLEHLEAIAQYITAVKRVDEFKDFVADSRKRPNAYFGYAVGIPLNVEPQTADDFFASLPDYDSGDYEAA